MLLASIKCRRNGFAELATESFETPRFSSKQVSEKSSTLNSPVGAFEREESRLVEQASLASSDACQEKFAH